MAVPRGSLMRWQTGGLAVQDGGATIVSVGASGHALTVSATAAGYNSGNVLQLSVRPLSPAAVHAAFRCVCHDTPVCGFSCLTPPVTSTSLTRTTGTSCARVWLPFAGTVVAQLCGIYRHVDWRPVGLRHRAW